VVVWCDVYVAWSCQCSSTNKESTAWATGGIVCADDELSIFMSDPVGSKKNPTSFDESLSLDWLESKANQN